MLTRGSWLQHVRASAQGPRRASSPKVAYIMSRFPKLTETFVLFEMLALERQGVQVEIYPLLRARHSTMHPEGAPLWKKIAERLSPSECHPIMHAEAAQLVRRAHFEPFLSRKILRAQLSFLRLQPRAYLHTLWALVRGTSGSPNYLLGALAIFPKCVYLAQQMTVEGVQHVHAHFANHPAAAAFIIHRLTGLPYSFTAHGADLQVDQRMLREKVEDAAFVVAISTDNRNLILARCGDHYREKVRVIHCGVDTQVFMPHGAQVQPEWPPRPFTILCIATMYEVKGHPFLIEACRLLHERSIEFQCLLVGDGPNRSALVQQVEHRGLGHLIHFLGPQSRTRIAELLGRADVLVVPSVPTPSGRREGIPVVLMEALACGVPVVASAISGIPELVQDGENGLLIPPRDPEAMAGALEFLHKNASLRGRMGLAGRRRVLSEFDLDQNAAMLAHEFILSSQS